MKSYRVAATGKDRAGKNKPYKVSITVEGWDEIEAKQKALAYLDKIYSACNWSADAVNIVPTVRGARRPTILSSRSAAKAGNRPPPRRR